MQYIRCFFLQRKLPCNGPWMCKIFDQSVDLSTLRTLIYYKSKYTLYNIHVHIYILSVGSVHKFYKHSIYYLPTRLHEQRAVEESTPLSTERKHVKSLRILRTRAQTLVKTCRRGNLGDFH